MHRHVCASDIHTSTKTVGLDVELAFERGMAAVSGDLDYGTRHLLSHAGERLLASRLALRSHGPCGHADRGRSRARAELDVSGVRFIDASGLGTLLAVRGAFADAGLELRLVNPSRCVRRICALCNLSSLLEQGTAAPATLACEPDLRSRERRDLGARSEVEP